MQATDVFVLSSHYETFGVVIIEALACGKPVVATRAGGPECIIHEKNGILVSPENIEELAVAMIKLRTEVKNYDSGFIYKDCVNRFGQKAVVEQVSFIYRVVLEKTGKK